MYIQHYVEYFQELQQSIERLAASMLPWKKMTLHETPTAIQLTESVDLLLREDELPREQSIPSDGGRTSQQPSRQLLLSMVMHFQHLFDVPELSGVSTRMNGVYNQLGEAQNILRTLRDILGLGTYSSKAICLAWGKILKMLLL